MKDPHEYSVINCNITFISQRILAMFNYSILVVFALSLYATIAPVASKTIFDRNDFYSNYEEPFGSESGNHYERDTYIDVDDKDKSEEFFYEEATLLGQQVAEADRVPPPKYAYETTNEKHTKPIKDSNVYANHKIQYAEDGLFNNDEELKTDEELEQERLRDLEAQMIPVNNDENESLDYNIPQFKNHQPIIGDSKEILGKRDREFENNQSTNNDDNDELDSGFGRSNLEIKNHQDTDTDEDLEIFDHYDTAFQAENYRNADKHYKLNNGFVNTLEVKNHHVKNIDDFLNSL